MAVPLDLDFLRESFLGLPFYSLLSNACEVSIFCSREWSCECEIDEDFRLDDESL